MEAMQGNVWTSYAIGFNSDPPFGEDWPLVQSPRPIVSLTVGYFLMVWLGPKYMARRPAFELRIPLIIYNLLMTSLNLCITTELAILMAKLQYDPTCDPGIHRATPDEINLTFVFWWYLISKIIEFMDTVFIIARKKHQQLSFLHVFHHASVPLITWIGGKFLSAGFGAYMAMMNSFIHVVMYGYYGLSAMGLSKHLWWKKHITNIQIAQFIVNLVMQMSIVFIGCGYHILATCGCITFNFCILLLFGIFYWKEYQQKMD